MVRVKEDHALPDAQNFAVSGRACPSVLKCPSIYRLMPFHALPKPD